MQVQHVIARCMAKQPHERYTSAADLRTDLESLLSGDTANIRLQAGAPGRSAPSSRKSSSHKSIAKMLLACCATLAVVAGVLFVQTRSNDTGGGNPAVTTDTLNVDNPKLLATPKIALNRGKLHLNADRLLQAEAAFERGLELIDSTPAYSDYRTAFDIKIDHTNVLRRLKKIDRALLISKGAVEDSKHLMLSQQLLAQRTLSVVFSEMGRHKEALNAALTSKQLAEKQLKVLAHPAAEPIRECAQSYERLGDCYTELYETKQAETAYRKALEHSRRQDRVDYVLADLCMVAKSLHRQKRFDEAAKLMDEWIRLEPELNFDNDNNTLGTLAGGHGYLGELKRHQADKDSAHQEFEKEVEICSRMTGYIRGRALANAYDHQAINCYFFNEIEEGDKASRLAVEEYEKAGEPIRAKSVLKAHKSMRAAAMRRLSTLHN